ncbi:MAG: PIN domain-containing protein [Methanophagales archaeon]|nr:PIN domain-containing protein [Methanophagales archaeon]
MGHIYIDTGALIALSDRNDKNHERAVLYFKTAVKRRVLFVLGKHVVIEYIDGVAKRINKIKAIQELDSIIGSKLLLIEWENKKDWVQAIEYFKRYKDQKIDLTDCLSFSIMERMGIDTAFTFDSDFQTHGFKVML